MDASNKRIELWWFLLLMVLAYLLFFHMAGERYIWSPDEDEYALVNREMVEDGHWIFPTANGEPYSIKPPLFNWIGSLISLANGEVTEATSRLPSALAATLCVFFLYFLGKLLFGIRAARLSVLVLATSPLFIEFARWIQINMMSTMLLTATLYLFYRGYTDEKQRNLSYLLMYIPMGLGTLNMGPVNVVMPAIVIAAYLFFLKDCRHILKLRIGWGLLIFLLIVAPWHVAVGLQESYAHNIFIETNLTRFFGKFAHARPFYYYFTTTPPYFLPWLLYLPAAIVMYVKRMNQSQKKKFLFPLVWAAGLFIFFSLSRTKRSEYLLPIFPALALMVGCALDQAFRNWNDSAFWRRCVTRPTYPFLALFIAAGLILPALVWFKASDWFWIALPACLFTIVSMAAAMVLLSKNRGYAAIITIVLWTAVLVAYGADRVVARVNDTKSARSFCLTINSRIPAGEKLKMYAFNRLVYAFYTHRFVEYTEEPAILQEWFASTDRVYAVTKEKKYLQIKDTFPLPLHVIQRQWVDHRFILLLSNRPDDPDTSG